MDEDRFQVDAPPPDRAGDFFSLFAASEGRIFAYILSLIPHWADAEEVFQETCVAMWRDFDAFAGHGDQRGVEFYRWAVQIAFYRVLTFRKRRRREPTCLSDEFIDAIAHEAVHREAELESRLRALAECINRLPQRDRELLAERYSNTQTSKAAAETLGRPIDTVYKALKRIRTSLYHCINRALRAEDRS